MPFTENDVGKHLQATAIDYCVSYALQGTAYFAEIQTNVQYTVLQAALILTINIPLFISPPSSGQLNSHIFSAIIGFAAFCHLIVIITCTLATAFLNAAYSGADTLLARIECQPLLVLSTIINYIAIIATIVGILIVAFGRTSLDFYVQSYMCFIVILLVTFAAYCYRRGVMYQDYRVLKFYLRYCDPNGELKDQYLKILYDDCIDTSDDVFNIPSDSKV